MRNYTAATRLILAAAVEGSVLFYDLGETLSLAADGRRNRDQEERQQRIAKDWNRFRARTAAKLETVLGRHWPKAVRLTPVLPDAREEINRLIRLDDIVLKLHEYDSGSVYLSGTVLQDADGEHVNEDGVLMSECDPEGKPYPKAGPGERRWRVSMSYKGGVSSSDYHGIVCTPTAREAVEVKLAWNDDPENPLNKVNAQGFRPSDLFSCKREDLGFASAYDIDDEGSTFYFNGPNLEENDETRKVNKAFEIMSRLDTDPGAKSEFDSLLAEAMAASMGGMRLL
jgi:hypothetical protein